MGTPWKKIESTHESILRVNHAGERAAVKIYEGQLRVLKDSPIAETLQHMHHQERTHHAAFEVELKKHHYHPTLLEPLWDRLCYGLGVASALLGTKAAMACTVAIEEVIEEHYKNQLAQLPDNAADLKDTIQQCYEDEVAHKETGERYIPEGAPYKTLSKGIELACRAAIFLSKRV